MSQELLKEMGLKIGDAVKIEFDKEKEQIIVRHGKKQSQLPLGLKLKLKLK